MANSKYAYIRNFELPDPLLPGCFLVCRLDGHSFHRYVITRNEMRHLIIRYIDSFSEEHAFAKPNDERALQLMDHAAKDLMVEFKDIVIAFGESDEFRQALPPMLLQTISSPPPNQLSPPKIH